MEKVAGHCLLSNTVRGPASVSCAQLQVGEEEHEHDHQGEKSSGGEEAGHHHREGAEQNRT